MGRKDLLKDLMAGDAPPKTETPKSRAAPLPSSGPGRVRHPGGAIGAVSQSIAELKSRAIEEIDAGLIDNGGLADRLDRNPVDQNALVYSIRTYGQQVPVLLRPHPTSPGRYEVVYGRRRVRALKELGLKVKAMIRDLDDREAILAQGQENTARRDLSFIEKSNFARQMADAGYDRQTIGDALDVDKTVTSRMLAVAERVPPEVIAAIGAAPSVGRPRWQALADLIVSEDWDVGEMLAFCNGETSDKRFASLMDAVTHQIRRKAAAARDADKSRVELRAAGGRKLGEAKVSGKRTTLSFAAKDAAGFERWLIDNIDRIHRDWMADRGGEEGR